MVFPTEGMRGVPPPAENLLNPPPGKNLPSILHQIFIPPPPKVNSCYNPIKTLFLTVVTALVPFIF